MQRSVLLVFSLLIPVFLTAAPPRQNDPSELAARALSALNGGRLKEAIGHYRKLVSDFPEIAGFRMNLGVAYYLTGQFEDSVRALEAAVQSDPQLDTAYVYLGAGHLATGHPDRAIPVLQEFVNRVPEDPKALEMLGESLRKTGRFAEAAGVFQTLSRVAPRAPEGWYGLAQCFESLAGEAFARLQKEAPESSYWFRLVGLARMEQAAYEHAFYFLRQALERRPRLRGLHAAIAEIYERSGHPDWAAREKEKEQSLEAPDCAREAAACAWAAGRFQEVLVLAREDPSPASLYWQALACNRLAGEAFSRLDALPPSLIGHRARAERHLRRGSDQEAAAEWRKALALSPGHPAIRQELARALMKLRDYPGAWKIVEELLKDAPGSPGLLYVAGDILLNLQRPAEAIPFLEQVLEADSNHSAARASLGTACLNNGEAARAIPHLKAALADDLDGSRHYQLARAYQREGQADLAARTLEKHQEIQAAGRARKDAFEQDVRITPP